MILDIITSPAKILRQKAQTLTTKEIHEKNFPQFLRDMTETMLAKDGIGLAAPQINVSSRVIVVNTKEGILPFINPVITHKSWKKQTDEEGCLSVPGIYGNVRRPYQIDLQALDSDGHEIKLTAKGLFARVIQHEIDHLDGILFIDHTKKIHREKYGRKYQ
ncbi:MAG: peptide deformylase [Patescibacteria group bacterium]